MRPEPLPFWTVHATVSTHMLSKPKNACEGARRQRDDASELGEALVLGGHELARALGRRRVLLDDERAEVGAVGQLRAGAQLSPVASSPPLSSRSAHSPPA